MSPSSQNPTPSVRNLRNDLRNDMVYLLESVLASSDARDAVDVLDELIAESILEGRREERSRAVNEAITAARGEYLTDNTGAPEDEAYNQAVSDVVAAIGALLEGGAR
ncbi:hypothetical protein [Streptomyces sp. bgisy154]|uniref:hypothetical protein n=1 Tax=Streptomyces sp. bgisy154 TaxID=3413794 RepID=UPI003D71CD06